MFYFVQILKKSKFGLKEKSNRILVNKEGKLENKGKFQVLFVNNFAKRVLMYVKKCFFIYFSWKGILDTK